MDIAVKVVPPMTFDAVCFPLMAPDTPFSVRRRPITMRTLPAGGVDICKGDPSFVAQSTSVIRLSPIMAIQTEGHARHDSLRCHLFLAHIAVTGETGDSLGRVLVVVEQNRPIRVGRTSGLLGIAMTTSAGLEILDVVTHSAWVHGWQILILCRTAGFDIGMAIPAF
jgi:hypothetical protein